MKIIRIEDDLFFAGYAKDYVSAVDYLVSHNWLTDEFEINDHSNGELKTIKEALGKDWKNIVKGWNIEKFNDYFDLNLCMYEMDVWET